MFRATLMITVAALLGACATATPPPATLPNGLTLVKADNNGALYVKPAAQLNQYQHFVLAPCEVAFKKNWERDYNADRVGLNQRVSQKDMDRIKASLAAECDRYFTAALQREPGYNLVTDATAASDVLIIAPSIVDLDITSPDLDKPGISRAYTTSAGSMTMVLELSDATTSELLATAYDKKRDPTSVVTMSSKITNRQAADRALSEWSNRLREALDQALN